MSVQFVCINLLRTVWVSLLCLALVAATIDVKGQKRGGRDEPAPPPPPPTAGTVGRKINRPKPTPLKPVALIVNVPLGCRIWLNDSEVELQNSIRPISLNGQKVMTTYATETGNITIKGLKPGSYKLIARKENYREFNIDLSLAVESENVVKFFWPPTQAD